MAQFYVLSKTEESRRVPESRLVCVDLYTLEPKWRRNEFRHRYALLYPGVNNVAELLPSLQANARTALRAMSRGLCTLMY